MRRCESAAQRPRGRDHNPPGAARRGDVIPTQYWSAPSSASTLAYAAAIASGGGVGAHPLRPTSQSRKVIASLSSAPGSSDFSLIGVDEVGRKAPISTLAG